MARAGLTTEAVIGAALERIDHEGAQSLNLAALAPPLGVRQPSLYKHVQGLEHLRRLVALAVMTEIAERLERAVMGRAGDDALRELMRAYRRYVIERPGRYAMMPAAPLNDPLLEPTGRRLLNVFATVLQRSGLAGAQLTEVTRALRASAHGFVSIEASGGFGSVPDLDLSYDLLVDSLIAGLRSSVAV